MKDYKNLGEHMKVINAEFDGIDTRDYPDFADAFISYAEHPDGTPLTEDELDILNDAHRDLVHELVWNYIH
jgi:hypothetical protein